MGESTKIQWTDSSWTPIRAMVTTPYGPKIGWHCETVSEGCRNCYSQGINKRLGTGLEFKPGNLKHKNVNGDERGEVSMFLDEKMLLAPLRWKKPRMIFANSMTDLFADFVPDAWIDRMFAVMALCPQHTFQVLTKRSARMREYLTKRNGMGNVELCRAINGIPANLGNRHGALEMPLPNVWLGISAERQQEADERVPDLLATPAAVRFVSAEPLLSGIDFTRLNHSGIMVTDALRGEDRNTHGELVSSSRPRLDQVIIGGESGPKARSCWTPDIRSIVKQCSLAGVSCFVKQLGANVQDRNDAFMVDEPEYWPDTIDPATVEHDLNGTADNYQGAPVRIRLKDRKGGSMEEWPEDLRVRQFPTVAS